MVVTAKTMSDGTVARTIDHYGCCFIFNEIHSSDLGFAWNLENELLEGFIQKVSKK